MSDQTRTLEIGSISSGTFRPQDVIPALFDALASVAPSHAAEIAHEYPTLFGTWSDGSICPTIDDESDDQDTSWAWEALTDALQEYAPDGCYVGAHEGDGADIGVWPCSDFDSDNFGDWNSEPDDAENDTLPDYLGSDF